MSALRWLLWKPASWAYKLGLAIETGELRGNVVTQNLVAVARVS